MKATRTGRRFWVKWGACLLGCALASACVRAVTRRQTDIMEKTGGTSISAAELRARVNDLADRLAGRLEEAADRIWSEARDPAVRRAALALKVDAIPTIYTAAFRADPLIAALDLWGLTFQISQYVENGVGRDAFGPQQPLARDGARTMVAETTAFLRSVATNQETFEKARAEVERWATGNPIGYTFSARSSITPFLAQLRSEGRDAIVVVGEVSETVETLSERLNTYAAQLPRQVRWQAELMVSEMVNEHALEAAVGDLHDLGSVARRADGLLADAPNILGSAGSSARELVAGECRALLENVNGQRLQTLEYATAERRAVLEALREERIAVITALRQERIESLKEIDAIETRAVDSVIAGLKDVVVYTLWRVAALLLFLMVSATALGIIGYRLTRGRPRTLATT